MSEKKTTEIEEKSEESAGPVAKSQEAVNSDSPEDTNQQAKGLLKKEREFVIPGDKLVETMDYLPGRNCFRQGDGIFSKNIGLFSVSGRVVSVIPLSGIYIAKSGDMVIGEVTEIQNNGWIVNVNSLTDAFLPLSGTREYIDSKADLSRYFAIGDVLYAKINHASQNSIHLSMDDSRARKLHSGRIIKVSSSKVPRLIGKQGSMILLIKGRTGCRISVGQNGFVWLEGEKEDVAIRAIDLVQKESYIGGLTDKVSEFFNNELGAAKPSEQTVPNEVDIENPAEEIV